MGEASVKNVVETTVQKMKDMLDVNTVMGEPISAGDGITILPISRVSCGFGSGGTDFPTKQPKDCFGGGAGGGVSVTPVGFLVVKGQEVRLLQLSSNAGYADRLINLVPEVVDKIVGLFKKDKKEEAKAETFVVTKEAAEDFDPFAEGDKE